MINYQIKKIMPSQSTTSAAQQDPREKRAKLLRGLMDRKTHNFTWPYTYPPFSAGAGWFPVNGMSYHPQFTGGGNMDNIPMGVPVWVPSPADMRGMPAMSTSRQRTSSQAQDNNGTSSTSDNNAGASPSRNPPTPDNTNSHTAMSGALVPPHASSPMTVDATMQCLSGQLHDAIQLCDDCIKTHGDFVAKVDFTTAETRNGVWKDLLEHKLKNSGFVQDGFNNLGRRLAYYMEQACYASQNDPALRSGEQEVQRGARDRVRRLRLLRATCDEVVKLSDGVMVDVLDCEEMLGLMKDMVEKLGGKARKDQSGNGEDGGGSGEAQSAQTWNT